MKRTHIIFLSAVLIAVLGCRPESALVAVDDDHAAESTESHAEGEVGRIELTAEQRAAAGVEVQPAATMRMQSELTVPGVVNPIPERVAIVSPPVAGRVVQVFASLGDVVTQGQTLALIESPELAQGASAIADAESRVLDAQASFRESGAQQNLAMARVRSAEQVLNRQRELAREGVFSLPSLQAARNEVNDAQAELASARSSLAAIQNVLTRAERLFAQGLVAGAEVDAARVDLQQATIRRERATQRLTSSEQTLSREQRVHQEGLLNAREVQSAEAEVRGARLEAEKARIVVESARAAVLASERAVRNARVLGRALRGGKAGSGSTMALTAPIEGLVTERQVTVGQAVERSSDLFDIQNLEHVFVTANVPERDVRKVRLGAPVRVVSDAAPGVTLTGTVRRMGTALDAKARTLPVQVLVRNPKLVLRPAGFARVMLGVGASEKVVAVPKSAVSSTSGVSVVFVERAGGFEARPVTIGRTSGDFVEVVEGVNAGEAVVVKGVFSLVSHQQKADLKGHDH